jgi:hypothetical protein
MKSERRHELQHNVLADWLAKTAETLKPYQNLILSVVTVAVVGVAVYAWWSREAASRTAQSWEELGAALETGSPADLAKVIENHPGTTIADMAALYIADGRLAQGCNALFVNKAEAQNELSKAMESYTLVRQSSHVPALVQRAVFGLARAKEAKGESTDIAEAKQLYEEVAGAPDCAYAAAARERLDDLKKPATMALYDRFAQFDPKPAFSPAPGGKPAFDMNALPNDGPLAPSAGTPEPKASEKAPEPGKAEETKPSEGATPAEEPKPSGETTPSTPSDEKKTPQEPGK